MRQNNFFSLTNRNIDYLTRFLNFCIKNKNYLFVGIVFFIASIPLLKMGFSGDDIGNTLVKGSILRENSNLLTFTTDQIMLWIHNGRLFPIALLITYTFCYIFGSNLLLYNFFHWIFVLISYITTGFFLKKLDLTNNNILLFFCLLPFCWFLKTGSSLVAFTILLPALVILMMLVFINYINFLKTKRTKYSIYITIFTALALLTYELSFFLIVPIIFLLNKYYEGKYFLRNKPFYSIFFISFLYFLIVASLRHLFIMGYPGIVIGNPTQIPITFLKQLSGEWPVLCFLDLRHVFHQVQWSTYCLTLLLTVGNLIIIYKSLKKEPVTQVKFVFFISILLQIIPAFIVSLTKKYQMESAWGNSYAQVYIQQIGLTIMLIIFLKWIISASRLSSPRIFFLFKMTLSSLLTTIISLNFLINISTANNWNEIAQNPREIYQKALEKGLFSQLPANAMVLRPGFHSYEDLWNTKSFLQLSINRKDILTYDFLNGAITEPLSETESEKEIEIILSKHLLDNNVFYLDFKNLPFNSAGYAFLGQVINKRGMLHKTKLKLDNIKIFYTANSQENLKKVLYFIADTYGLKNNKQFMDKINSLISKQSKLSGWIYLSDDFYWENDLLRY